MRKWEASFPQGGGGIRLTRDTHSNKNKRRERGRECVSSGGETVFE